MLRASSFTLYDYIYSFVLSTFFSSEGANTVALYSAEYSIGGTTLRLREWLSHSVTITIMILAVILCCLLVRWVWRLVTSAFLLK